MPAGVNVDRASMVKIATQLGKDGKPAPSWVSDDPGYLAAYDQGKAGGDAPAPAPAKKAPAKKAPAKTGPTDAEKAAADAAKQQANAAKAQQAASAKQAAAAQKLGNAAFDKTTGGINRVASSDAGGLVLALVLYPLLLSIVKYGAKGPGMWFRAKWLNKPDGVESTAPISIFGVSTPAGSLVPGVTPATTTTPAATPTPAAPAKTKPKTKIKKAARQPNDWQQTEFYLKYRHFPTSAHDIALALRMSPTGAGI